MRLVVEEHDGGAQLVRVRSWPRLWIGGMAAILAFALLAAGAAADGAWPVAVVLAAVAAAMAVHAFVECAGATACLFTAIDLDRAGSAAPAVGAVEVSEA
jgi:hypothetical protein